MPHCSPLQSYAIEVDEMAAAEEEEAEAEEVSAISPRRAGPVSAMTHTYGSMYDTPPANSMDTATGSLSQEQHGATGKQARSSRSRSSSGASSTRSGRQAGQVDSRQFSRTAQSLEEEEAHELSSSSGSALIAGTGEMLQVGLIDC